MTTRREQFTLSSHESSPPQAPPPCIEVRGLSVEFDGRRVLDEIDWTVPCGRLVAVIGPNGGGKSTLLRTLIGRVRPVQGEVRLFGRRPAEVRGRVAYLPQNKEIDWRFPIRTLDVVMQGRLGRTQWWQLSRGDDRRRALAALERVRLAEHADRPVGDLSGGQRQRALLARALVQDADLILFDEPSTGLDASSQHDLLDLLKELRDEGRTVVTTTHDLDCLTDGFDDVICLRGRVICHGPPRETLTPENLEEIFGRHVPLLTPKGEVTMIEHR